jgi:hypothetical protein
VSDQLGQGSGGGYYEGMIVEDIAEIIAERGLASGREWRKSKDVIVRLGKPQPHPGGSGFFSPFELIGLGQRKVRYASGIDAFQSLQLVSNDLWLFGPLQAGTLR